MFKRYKVKTRLFKLNRRKRVGRTAMLRRIMGLFVVGAIGVGCTSLLFDETVQTLPIDKVDSEQIITSLQSESPSSTVIPTKENVATEVAIVDSVSVSVSYSSGVLVQLDAQGILPDGCTEISHSDQLREDDYIYLTIYTTRPKDQICTDAIMSWQRQFNVDVHGFAAATYTLVVNGQTADFTIENN